ncbi:MAG: hypothetical protein ACREL1_01165 [bacterium]
MRKLFSSRQIWILSGLALFSAFVNFCVIFKSSVGLDLKISRLLESHLVDILVEKDDLELIDWENHLNHVEPTLSLRVLRGGKALLSSGNLQWVSPNSSLGGHFQFPNRFLVHEKRDIPGLPGASAESFISLPLIPNPWIAAVINLFIIFLTGLGLLLIRTSTPPADTTAIISSPGAVSAHLPSTPHADEPSTATTLRVDPAYLIQSISKKAAYLFEKNPADVQGHHLLDLSPHPRLLEILKKDEKNLQKIEGAFLTHPRLNAIVQTDLQGWTIEIQSSENG